MDALAHDSPHIVVAQGLEVSRGDVLQHQRVQAQLSHQPLQLRVLLFKFLQTQPLSHLKAAKLLASAIAGLLCDQRLFAGLYRRLSVRHRYFNLPKQAHDLLIRYRATELVQVHFPSLDIEACRQCDADRSSS
jgi:hypothetical protein